MKNIDYLQKNSLEMFFEVEFLTDWIPDFEFFESLMTLFSGIPPAPGSAVL